MSNDTWKKFCVVPYTIRLMPRAKCNVTIKCVISNYVWNQNALAQANEKHDCGVLKLRLFMRILSGMRASIWCSRWNCNHNKFWLVKLWILSSMKLGAQFATKIKQNHQIVNFWREPTESCNMQEKHWTFTSVYQMLQQKMEWIRQQGKQGAPFEWLLNILRMWLVMVTIIDERSNVTESPVIEQNDQ